VFAKITFGFTL